MDSLPVWQLCNFMSDGKPMLAIQQLLIKGLFKQETELATVQVRIWASANVLHRLEIFKQQG